MKQLLLTILCLISFFRVQSVNLSDFFHEKDLIDLDKEIKLCIKKEQPLNHKPGLTGDICFGKSLDKKLKEKLSPILNDFIEP